MLTLPIYYKIEYKTKKPKNILVWQNRYRNAHHFESNNIKHYYHELVKVQNKWSVYKWKVIIKYNVFLRNIRTDWPNIRSVIEKFTLDWLVECWAIEWDTADIVIWDSSSYFIDKLNPRCEIIISEI